MVDGERVVWFVMVGSDLVGCCVMAVSIVGVAVLKVADVPVCKVGLEVVEEYDGGLVGGLVHGRVGGRVGGGGVAFAHRGSQLSLHRWRI